MTITAPQTAMRNFVRDALNAEFAADEITFIDDKLHPSLGSDGPVAGVYPAEDVDMPSQQLVLEMTCYVQLFLKWDKEINPEQIVDPAPIEEAAERIRRALEAAEPNSAGTADVHLWEAHVTRVSYPHDPTGNMTRLEATVFGRAQNSALTRTAG